MARLVAWVRNRPVWASSTTSSTPLTGYGRDYGNTYGN